MKLEFDTLDEMINFLIMLGYRVEKRTIEGMEEIEGKIEEKTLTITDKELEEMRKKFPQNPYPYPTTSPYYPIYPSYPVTCDTRQDENLSSKFYMNNKGQIQNK
jgi:hypothetical protein